MAVVDPNFENFNYGQLLANASQPLATLGQGQLAIAQQNNQRNFALLAQQRESQLMQEREQARLGFEARNRMAENAQQEQLREKQERSSLALNQQEQRKQAVANAQQINPSFKENPNDSDETTIARAKKVGEDQIVSAYKSGIDTQNKLNSDYEAKLEAQGLPPNINGKQVENLVGQKIANDPDFIRSLTPAMRQSLANGSLTATVLVNRLLSTRLGGVAEGIVSGYNPNTTASQLAAKAQQYRQDIVTNFHQANLAALGFEGQQALSRYNQQNDINQKLLAQLPANRLNEVMQYQGQNSPAGALSQLSKPATTPDGLLPSLAGTGTAAPSTATLPPSPAQTDPVLQHVDFKSAVNLYQGAQARQNAAQATVDSLSRQIMSGDDLPVSQREQLSKDYQKAKSDLAKSMADKASAEKQGYSVYHSLNTTNSVPNFGAAVGNFPGGTNYQGPSSFPPTFGTPQMPTNGIQMSFPTQGSPANAAPSYGPGIGAPPLSPNLFPPPGTTGQPSAMNTPNGQVDPMAYRAAQNQVAQSIGTSDPQVLQQAKVRAQQLGINVQALVQGVAQNDPHAIATAKGLISDVQNGGNGSSGVMPDMSSGLGQQSMAAFGA